MLPLNLLPHAQALAITEKGIGWSNPCSQVIWLCSFKEAVKMADLHNQQVVCLKCSHNSFHQALELAVVVKSSCDSLYDGAFSE